MTEKLTIVSLDKIPTFNEIKDVNLTNLHKVHKTCMQLRELCERENGIGISAAQVGISEKIFLIKMSNDKFGYFINCTYIPVGTKKYTHLEGCLSLKGENNQTKLYKVQRYNEIIVSGFCLLDEFELVSRPLVEYHVEGFKAAVFQHEIDHQYGRDRMIDVIGEEAV